MCERFMNSDFLRMFINEYKKYPCLWQIKSKEYKDIQTKAIAWGKLVEVCRQIHPEATVPFVKTKIKNLRTVFRKELKKVIASKKLIAGGREVYSPKLWYYDLLMFTADEELAEEAGGFVEDDDEEQFIQEVGVRPVIYDKYNPEYERVDPREDGRSDARSNSVDCKEHIRLQIDSTLDEMCYPKSESPEPGENSYMEIGSSGKRRKMISERESGRKLQDSDEMFLMSLLPALKRINPKQNSLARLKIQQVLFDIEFEDN